MTLPPGQIPKIIKDCKGLSDSCWSEILADSGFSLKDGNRDLPELIMRCECDQRLDIARLSIEEQKPKTMFQKASAFIRPPPAPQGNDKPAVPRSGICEMQLHSSCFDTLRRRQRIWKHRKSVRRSKIVIDHECSISIRIVQIDAFFLFFAEAPKITASAVRTQIKAVHRSDVS